MVRKRRGHLLLAALLAAFGAWVFSSSRAFSALQRRSLVAAIAAEVLLPGPASAGDRDREQMVRNARRQFLPTILDSYKKLQADGEVSEKFATGKAGKKFVNALEGWGSIQRMTEAPDKISRKLLKDASAIEKALNARDYQQTMALLETYKADVPQLGASSFEWTDPE